MEHVRTSREKALEINLDNKIYGTFAEIGAGQEVARHFFRAGGAAGTIAKSISAYDMAMSDAIYGRDTKGRYVSDGRLVQMLEREFNQLMERLAPLRDPDTRYFAFADTVAAKSYKTQGEGHGWMGVRFQHAAKAPFSQVVLHMRLVDNQNILQQEALGMIGVNLLYASYFENQSVESFTCSLLEGLTPSRMLIDMIQVQGPAFKGLDPRLVNLELVKKGMTQAVMFGKNGQAIRPGDALYKQNVAVVRGSFRPPTLLNMDMLTVGPLAFKKCLSASEKENLIVLPEISMGRLLERGEVNSADFLDRVDILGELGHQVMISNKESFPELNQYLLGITQKDVALVTGIYNMEELFKDRPGSHLVARIGDVFTGRTRFFIYPAQKEGQCIKLKNMEIPEAHKGLLDYLMGQGLLNDIEPENPAAAKIWSRKVLQMIQHSQEGWEEFLPPTVAKAVREKKLFGLK